VIAVDAFLRRFPPFDDLSEPDLQRVVDATRIEFFSAGTEILREGGPPVPFLYVIRTGAVELLSEGSAIDLLGEGEAFGHPSLTSGLSPAFSVRAHEDTLCYLIARDTAEVILASRPGLAFLSASLRRRTERVLAIREADRPDPRLTRVGLLLRRAPVTCRPDERVGDAARRMAAERVSSLLVIGGDVLGIVTDRDLRTRVLAEGRDGAIPVADVMTAPVVTVAEDEPAEEALLSMLDHGVHHLPVISAGGRVVGIVSDTDLMGLERTTPFALRAAIERAADDDAVAAVGHRLGQAVVELVDAEFDPVLVGRVVAMAVDAMTRRLLELAFADVGQPAASWCWIAFGSQARHEQALATDQDHALAFDARGTDAIELDRAFEAVARRVTDGLEAAGIPRCRGGIMAERPEWRHSVDAWRTAFPELLRTFTREAREFTSIAIDHRAIAGPLDFDADLDEAVRAAARDPRFTRRLAAVAVQDRPPTGFLRDLVVERAGEHAGTFDVKARGIVLIAALARARAIALDVRTPSTIQRLRAAAAAGTLTDDAAEDLEEAFRFLWRIRAEHQVARLREGAPVDDHVDPGTLGRLTRVGLKEAFRAIGREQASLATEHGLRLR
jgi:CBS domain-containing protein